MFYCLTGYNEDEWTNNVYSSFLQLCWSVTNMLTKIKYSCYSERHCLFACNNIITYAVTLCATTNYVIAIYATQTRM